jgi:hypothetical protein
VDVLGGFEATFKRSVGARMDRGLAFAELADEERILDSAFERHVAGDDGDRLGLDGAVAQRYDEGDRVVRTGTRVDQEGAHGGEKRLYPSLGYARGRWWPMCPASFRGYLY